MKKSPQNNLRIFANARPSVLPLPRKDSVEAFTGNDVFERWSEGPAAVRSIQASDVNVIEMYDRIGYDWWTDGGVTAKGVAEKLKAFRGQDIEVHINSPGGDMFEGFAIYNILRDHDARVHVKAMGMVASSASVIAMAGDTIEIGAASFMMIHNCSVNAGGNRHDMREIADWLEPFDGAMSDLYAERSQQKRKEIAAWMDAETYMSGVTAVERGFADTLLASDKLLDDVEALAPAKEVHAVRAMEMSLVSGGMTRTAARAHIKEIKGTPGATRDTTQDAGEFDWAASAAGLLKTITS